MTPAKPLGRLEKVDLREIWAGEASDFTPWLAQEENIEILGDSIGVVLEVHAQEKQVGPFRADVLCKSTADDHWVLVENQLERTDHTHLGQLLTYAAGLDAATVVWIAQRFTDEHRAALDWLNENTGDDLRFFGLEVELWRIGASPPAPKFNIVSKPNDWTKEGSGAKRRFESELTDTQELQLQYWQAFRTLMDERGGEVKPTKPPAQHWQSFAIGRSYFHLNTFANTRDKRIGVQPIIHGPDAKAHFRLLEGQREALEGTFGEPLEWKEMPTKKESHINLRRHGSDPSDRESWPEQQEWLLGRLERFYEVFRPRVKELNAADWRPDADDE